MIFKEFGKIPRLKRDCVITEKIDGTNACACVFPAGISITEGEREKVIAETVDGSLIFAQSRTRLITPDDDNFGFASFVKSNYDELAKLGPGRHFGEWWGKGIQRGYGLQHRKFSLFRQMEQLPECVDSVPVIYEGVFSTVEVDFAISKLAMEGSIAAPGFMDPEGVVVYHGASGTLHKVTVKGDEKRKTE